MPSATTVGLFALAGLVLVVTPGPAVLYIVGEGVNGGRRAGVVSALGIFTGGVLHVILATVGVGTLVAASPTAFSILKMVGGAYLLYLGVKRLRSRRTGAVVQGSPGASDASRFRRGVLVNALNPKAAVFFVAFLPQFIEPGAARPHLQAAVLGAVFVVVALASDTLYAMVSGSLGAALATSPTFAAAQRWVSGLLYIGLGLSAGFTVRPA